MANQPFTDQPLLSAEIHYFRIPRDDWELLLLRMRQLGANTIATCVPWLWHAAAPGAFDMEGRSHPQRDLVGFVRLCGRLGLRAMLKPGPSLGGALLGGGIPPWLLRERPQIHALHRDGQVWRHAGSGAPCVSALHPDYLAPARCWVAAFSAALLPLQAPAGPIIAVQIGEAPACAGTERSPRPALDYNPYVVSELWMEWLRETAAEDATFDLTDHELRATDHAQSTLPRTFAPLANLSDLRRCIALDAFAAWCHVRAAAIVAGWLREDGWTAPVCYSAPAADRPSADLPGLARATGWLGYQFDAEDTARQGSFEEYVRDAHWRTRLIGQLSPGLPAFATEVSAARDFAFAAPFVGGLQAVNVYTGAQLQSDNPSVGACMSWALDAPVRPDGSVRPRLWNARSPLLLLGAAQADFAAARAPADLALGYSHVPERVRGWLRGDTDYLDPALAAASQGCDMSERSQSLAQRLVRAGVAFDVLDLDAATPEQLARYALLVVPAAAVLARATQARLAGLDNLALVGDARALYDEHIAPCDILADQESSVVRSPWSVEGQEQLTTDYGARTMPARLPDDVTGEQLAELVEARAGTARYAWADAEDVDVSVRHGREYTFLFVANRRPAPYSGTLTYRAPDGSIQHLHVGIGGPRVGIALIKDDEVLGVAIGGDGAEGGWLVRGLHTSVVFNAGAGVVAPCGAGLLASAPQSGRFQVRRQSGWDGLAARRLLLSGALVPALFQTDAAHLLLPYTAEDERGQTDMYMLLPEDQPLPPQAHDHTATLLQARAQALRRAADLARAGVPEAAEALALAAEVFAQAAAELEHLADRAYTLDEYGAAWDAAGATCRPAIEALAHALAQARGDHLAGALDAAAYEVLEDMLTRVLGIVAHWSQ